MSPHSNAEDSSWKPIQFKVMSYLCLKKWKARITNCLHEQGYNVIELEGGEGRGGEGREGEGKGGKGSEGRGGREGRLEGTGLKSEWKPI